MAAGLQAKGMPPNIALGTAYKMIDGSVSVQATVLSYMDIFLYIGLMFLVFVPIVLLFIRNAKNKVSLADAGH
jgi:DHA2 family multidrug resistance protein